MSKRKGPQFLRFCLPIIEVLNELGGSGKPSEITDMVIDSLGISEDEVEETTSNGASRIRNQVAWARFYLAKAGYLDSSERGTWRITGKAQTESLSEDGIFRMFKEVQASMPRKSKPVKDECADEVIEELQEETNLLNVLRSLSPEGFERICKLLLLESGFERVEVTGQSVDGGIDGHGVLEVNPFVSFKVLFQCKRYTKQLVSSPQVRDFRGAMQGRADKGIILTTGEFTSDAKKEARRDGAPPIELVNGAKLVSMFEHTLVQDSFLKL